MKTEFYFFKNYIKSVHFPINSSDDTRGAATRAPSSNAGLRKLNEPVAGLEGG